MAFLDANACLEFWRSKKGSVNLFFQQQKHKGKCDFPSTKAMNARCYNMRLASEYWRVG